MKLVLGTAEFSPSGYAGIEPLKRKDIRSILVCAKEAGITLIDTAESYDCQQILKEEAKGFCIYTKTRDWKVSLDWGENELRGILYHYQENETPIKLPEIHRWVNLGVSVYTKQQLPDEKRLLQVPFNLINRQFRGVFSTHRTVFVRSVFGRGSLLSHHSIKDCLDFVKSYRPDGIIVGVKNHKELTEIINAYTA